MVALNQVELINDGVPHQMLNGVMYFGESALNKKYSGLVIQDVDVVTIGDLPMVKLSDVDSSNAKLAKKKK